MANRNDRARGSKLLEVANGALAPEEAPAEWAAIEALKPWEENPRKNQGEPVARVVKSMRRFGFGAPILARRENGEIIAGHTRWLAAQALKLKRVPVRWLDLDEREAHLLALADNRINELTKWNNEGLGDVLSSYSFEDAGVAGFEVDDLGRLLKDGETPEVEELPTSVLADRFWLSVEGPIAGQAQALKLLREALGKIDGLTVDVRMVETT